MNQLCAVEGQYDSLKGELVRWTGRGRQRQWSSRRRAGLSALDATPGMYHEQHNRAAEEGRKGARGANAIGIDWNMGFPAR